MSNLGGPIVNSVDGGGAGNVAGETETGWDRWGKTLPEMLRSWDLVLLVIGTYP